MMISKYILPLAILFSTFILSCGSDTKKEGVQVQATEQAKEVPTTTTAPTPPTPPQPSPAEKQSANVIGTAMNAATSIAVSGIGIPEGNFDKDKIIAANQSVQKAFKDITAFKKTNPNYFASDSPHNMFFNAFTKFAKASEKMISEMDSGNLKSYNAALNKAYNELGKAYGGYEF